jgi:hypothetical protein
MAFAAPGADPARLQTHAGVLLMASIPAVKLWSAQLTKICHILQAPCMAHWRTALSVAEAAVTPTVAQPVPSVVPTAGQPHGVPVATTPVELHVIGAVQGIVVDVAVMQPLASIVHWPKVAAPAVGQKEPAIGGVPQAGLLLQTHVPVALLQVWFGPQTVWFTH